MNNSNIQTKNENGITLIVLVITIIVLTILLGVSFSFILGDNNIIDSSTEYVSSTEKDLLIEEMDILLLKYKLLKMDNNISIMDYFKSFDPEEGYSNISNNGDGTYTIFKDNMEILINEHETLNVK